MKRFTDKLAFRTIAGIVFLLIIFSIIAGAIGFRGITGALLEQYSEEAFRTAEIAASVIDADKIQTFAESEGKTDEYQETKDKLQRICDVTDSTFIYIIQPDTTDYGHITFIFSTMNTNYDYNLYDFGYVRETTNDEYRNKYRLLYETNMREELVVRDKGYIETDPHITAMYALRGSNYKTEGILCVQKQMEALSKTRNEYVRLLFLAFIVLSAVVGIIESIQVKRYLLEPVDRISKEASRFAEENVMSGTKLADYITDENEIGLLARSIDRMEEQIQDHISNITRITAERERIETELDLAGKIQASILPNEFPAFPDRDEFDIHASMTPAKEVGGDFYNFFFLDDNHLCMVIADVSGKGIPGALFMMASMIMIYDIAQSGKSPAEILKAVNDQISGNNREEMFITVWLGIVDLRNGDLVASNGGHEYPILMNPDGDFEIIKDKHGLVLGAMEGIKYTDYHINMRPGSKLFVYTDGVPEATDTGNNLFGIERTVDALNCVKGKSPEAVLESINDAVDSFTGDAEQFDDLTMLCFEFIKYQDERRS